MTRRIRFNAFEMNCVAHQSPGLWRHPRDQSHRYTELSYRTELACRARCAARVPGTLRTALFGVGDRLPREHRVARYRLDGPGSTAYPASVRRPDLTATANS